MSNKVRKTLTLNRTNSEDQKIINKIKHDEPESEFNFNSYVRNLILEDIQKHEAKLKIFQRTNEGGIKIVVGR